MGTIHKNAVRGFRQLLSCDNTTVEYVCGGIGMFQQHSELSIMSKLARDQVNDLNALGDDECSMNPIF
jgi:hypothetical protein